MRTEPEPRRLLDALDDEQRHAVTVEAAPLCVIAGPGAGKTRVLTRRIAWQVAENRQDPRRVLVLTFTRAAARELRNRLADLGVRDVNAATLHSACLALWTQRLLDTDRWRPQLLKDRSRLLKVVLEEVGLRNVFVDDLDREITWASSRALNATTYPSAAAAAGRILPTGFDAIAKALDAYEIEKRRRKVVDFDDLLLHVLRDLEDDPGWAAAQRWRFQHLYVDEYQDLTITQQLIVEQLAGRPVGATADLCVVGDPNQSIFGFSGVDADNFDRFADRFPTATAVRLIANHRSAPSIVEAARTVIESQQVALRDDIAGQVAVSSYPTDSDEARGVARKVRALGRPYGQRAVLARTNAILDAVEAAFIEAGIPYVRQQDLLRRPEVRQALARLRDLGAHRPAIAVRFDLLEITSEILAAYDIGLDSDEGADGQRAEQEPQFDRLLASHHLDELGDLLTEFCRFAPDAPLESFLFWLNATSHGTGVTRPVAGAVDLRTIHRAKGLEWTDVFVVGCEQGVLPLRHSDPGEEDRLAYVAFSRAVRNLWCSWAEQRTSYGRAKRQTVSGYAEGLEGARIVETTVPPVLARERVAAMRNHLASHPGPTIGRRTVRRKLRPEIFAKSVRTCIDRGMTPRDAVLRVTANDLGVTVADLERRAAELPTLDRQIEQTVERIRLSVLYV